MNILIFSWRDIKHPMSGGAEQVMHEHAKGWIVVGHSVTHFSSRFKGSKGGEVIDGVEIIRRGHQYYLGVQWAAFIYYLKKRKKFDLIIDEFHGLPFFTPFYVRKKKLALVQETARKVWFLNPLPWPMNWVIGITGYILEPLFFLIYRKISFMTGSRSAKEDIFKMGIPRRNITVIPHGVIAPKDFSFNKKEKKWTIIFLGKLSKDKGIEDALKTFFILNMKEEYKFWILGKEETRSYFNRIIKMVNDLKLKGQVKFWGFVSEEKKFYLLAKSHVLINPSVHEGWGLVNIEANSVGTPVVAYRVSGSVDSVKDGVSGILCKENTPEELAKDVDEILNSNKLYKKLQKGTISWSKNFSWEKSRKLSLKLIENL